MSNEYFAANIYWLIETKVLKQLNQKKLPFAYSYEYIEGLYSLYRKSRGKGQALKTDQAIDDFIDWIIEYRNLTEKYAMFVNSHNIDLNSKETAELNKSIMDSIVGIEARVISPYAYTLNREVSNIVQKDKHTYIDNFKTLVMPCDEDITTIITQNPYYINPNLNYNIMRKDEGYNIGIGVYGYEDDLDKEEKLESLKRLAKELGYGRLYTEEEGKSYFSLFKAVGTPKDSKIKKIIARRSHK